MISADQLTLFQQSGTDYPHHITTAPPPGFSDLPTALTTFGTRGNLFGTTTYSYLTKQES